MQVERNPQKSLKKDSFRQDDIEKEEIPSSSVVPHGQITGCNERSISDLDTPLTIKSSTIEEYPIETSKMQPYTAKITDTSNKEYDQEGRCHINIFIKEILMDATFSMINSTLNTDISDNVEMKLASRKTIN